MLSRLVVPFLKPNSLCQDNKLLGQLQQILKGISSSGRRRRTFRSVPAELLETRALLSTLHVDASAIAGGDGSVDSPFNTIQAGIDAAAVEVGEDTVLIEPGVYDEFLQINDPSGALVVRGNPGVTAGVSINGGGQGVFLITPQFDVTIADLNIANGNRGIRAQNGSGSLTIDNVHASNFVNAAFVTDGISALTIRNSSGSSSNFGVFSRLVPTVVIENSQFSQNRIDGAQIQNTSSLLLSDVIASNNSQRGVSVFAATGTTEFQNLTATDNTVAGLGVFNGQTALTVSGGLFSNNGYHGIDITSVTGATISNVVVTENGSPQGGAQTGGAGIRAEMYLSNAVISIDDSLIENNSEAYFGGGGIEVAGTPSLVLERTTIRGNSSAFASGGGVLLRSSGTGSVIRDSVIEGNAGVFGGGIFFGSQSGNGALLIERTTIDSNSSTGDGGEGFAPADGGGLFVWNRTLTIKDSTISNNVSESGPQNSDPASGGGLAIQASTVTVQNSTISGNTAGLNGGGVAIHNGTGRQVQFIFATIADNTAGGAGGGIYRDIGGDRPGLANTIVAKNTASSAPDFSGVLVDISFNLIGDATGSTGANQNSPLIGTAANPVDPLIGPLSNNGGPTRTHELQPASPAIDAVGATNFVLTTDQRGVVRPQGSQRDIGAFERAAPAPLTLTVRASSLNETGSGTSTTGFVSRPSSSDLSSAVIVTLTSSDEGELSVPVTIEIPAGATTSGFFDVTAVDDAIVDGDQTVIVTASASGFLDSTDSVTVVDTTPPNTPPVADSQNPEVEEDSTLNGTLTASDADGDSVVFQLLSGPVHHFAFSFSSNGSFSYTPLTNFNGPDSFTFRAFDGTDYSDPATVSITVLPVNDAPTDLSLSNSLVDENVDTTNAVPIGVFTASDVDDDSLTFALVSGAGDSDKFEIIGNELRLRAGESVDFETQPSYTITASVTDGTVTYQQTFVISVVDDPGAPSIDVVPGSTANVLSKTFEVAFLSSSEFDAQTRIDFSTLTAGKTGFEDSLVRNKKTGTIKFRLEDVNNDGLLDVIVSVQLSKTGLSSGDTDFYIRGLTSDGDPFELHALVSVGGGKGSGSGNGNGKGRK